MIEDATWSGVKKESNHDVVSSLTRGSVNVRIRVLSLSKGDNEKISRWNERTPYLAMFLEHIRSHFVSLSNVSMS